MPQLANPLESLGAELATGSAAPQSPSEGDTYVVPSGASGPWYLWDGDLAIARADGSWQRKKARVGTMVFNETDGTWIERGAGGWFVSEKLGSSRSGLTASATQSQGQVPLGHTVNQFSTVGTTGDAATLPPAIPGRTCTVVNDGANSMQVFPALGDKIDGGSVDASVNVAAGKRRIFCAQSDSAWSSVLGA